MGKIFKYSWYALISYLVMYAIIAISNDIWHAPQSDALHRYTAPLIFTFAMLIFNIFNKERERKNAGAK